MQHMRTLAGPSASIAFTHLSHIMRTSLSIALALSSSSAFGPTTMSAQTLPSVECHEQGVLALMQARGIALEQVCLLDPKSAQALAPSDGYRDRDREEGTDAGKFKWFLFGLRVLSLLLFLPSLSSKHIYFPFGKRVYSVRLSIVSRTVRRADDDDDDG
jgi:Predicted SAM-dependent RNA methyltransferase